MKSILFLLFSLSTLTITAQSYIGYITDNYNGVHGVMANPANIADSRAKIDVNLISFSNLVANDYVGLSLNNIIQLADGFDFSNLNTFVADQNEFLINAEVMGPSFMFSLNKWHSIGLITRARNTNNYNNINGAVFEGLVDGFPSDSFDFEQSNIDRTSHIWGEVGLSYGGVIFFDDEHNFKAGVTLKYLMGGGFAQGFSESLSGNFNAPGNQLNLNGDFSYSRNFDEDQKAPDYLKNLSPGLGMDLGVVYEFRTRNSRLGAIRDNIRALNKYKVKVGLSLLDYGKITYKDQVLDRYTLNGTVNADDIEADFIEALDNNFTKVSAPGDITVALPAALKLNIDYEVVRYVYANLDINQTVVKQNGLYDNNRLNIITFTPRYETRAVSAYLPISYSALGQTAIGAGLRLGPIFIGSGSIISNLISDKAQTANVYFGLKVPINHIK